MVCIESMRLADAVVIHSPGLRVQQLSACEDVVKFKPANETDSRRKMKSDAYYK